MQTMRDVSVAEARRFLGVLVAALAVYAAGTHASVFAAGNDASRWAHVESLVDHGRPTIELSRFRGTVDRVVVDGRDYSNKPPLLAQLGAGLYAPLAALTGWRLGDPATAARVLWLLTVLLVGLPAAVTVAVFDRALLRHPSLGPRLRMLLTAGLAAGSLLLSFAVTLNNHVLASLLVLLAVLAAIDGRGLDAGLAVGLAGAVDILPGLGFVPVVAGILVLAPNGRRRSMLACAGGLAVAALVFVVGNVVTTGSLLPPLFAAGASDSPAAQAGPSLLGVVLPEGGGYALQVLFGGHGLLTVSPVLAFGVLGLLHAMRRPPFGARAVWVLVAAGVVAQYVGHAFVAGSFGGWSYGFRYLLPIQPLLLLAAPAALGARWQRAAFAAVLPVSVLFAALGAYHPWPPAFEQASSRGSVAGLVTHPVGGNAAAWAAAHLPGSRLAEALGRRFVSADPELRRQYLWLFFASKGRLATAERFAPRRGPP
jgi:hypothetical protein